MVYPLVFYVVLLPMAFVKIFFFFPLLSLCFYLVKVHNYFLKIPSVYLSMALCILIDIPIYANLGFPFLIKSNSLSFS